MRQRRWIAALLVAMSAAVASIGCFTGGVYQVPCNESLLNDLTAESSPRVARLQQLDPSDPKYRAQEAPQVLPPPPVPASALGNNTQQMSLSATRNVRVSVRAWINGKPLFDDEVMQQISPNVLRELAGIPEPQRSERLADAYNQALEGLIDQEVAYQDAVHKLEAGNKKALEKLKKAAAEEFDKQMKKIRETRRATEDQIKEIEHLLRKQTERGFIAGEYLRSRIFPLLVQQASAVEVKDYYDKHLNEFQRLDTVQWQDVFIAVGPKYASVPEAKRFAEDLIAQCRTNDDFVKLVKFDDGDSKFRNGEGLGTHKGEIRPQELEETLFKLKEGEIGPVIPLSTGVHIVRVTKRETAGLIPLDVKTQKQIENKIKNKVYENEYKRIIRELRNRATVEIEREQ